MHVPVCLSGAHDGTVPLRASEVSVNNLDSVIILQLRNCMGWVFAHSTLMHSRLSIQTNRLTLCPNILGKTARLSSSIRAVRLSTLYACKKNQYKMQLPVGIGLEEKFRSIFFPLLSLSGRTLVPDHDGGRPKQINAWFLYTHMVYL
jgi:hypothetical protein